MFYEIPTEKKLNNYEFSILLSEQIFFFQIQYSNRSDRYLLNISNSSKEIIVAGLPVLNNVLLTDYLKYLPIPQGDLIASGTEEAGYQKLGDTLRLYYNE